MSLIDKKEGLFDPTKRFAFTNITTEDFKSAWNSVPVIVKAGETIEISNVTPIPGAGHALAVLMTNQMIDQIIIGDAKLDEVTKNQPYYRSPKGMSLGVPAVRDIWEKQIVRELDADEESPALQTIRKQMREEIEQGIVAKQETEPVHIPTNIGEFADLDLVNRKETVQEVAPVKTKKLGRPKKNETTVPSNN